MAMKFKPGKNFFYFILGALALILIATGLLHSQLERVFSQKFIEKDLPDGIMFAAVGILLWNRKVRNDQEKAAAARKAAEGEEASARQVGAEDTAAEDTAAEDTAAEDTAAEDTAAEDTARDWPGLRKGAQDMRDAFAGLFAADELAFVQLFSDVLARAGDQPDKASRIEVSAQSDRLASVFGERLSELRSPVGEMKAASALFEDRAAELADLPVLLQTGKEDQAMKAVLYFIEIFNKVIRIIPELRRKGIDTAAISVGGSGMPEFYNAFNDVLRQLTDAFEHKDSVLIGDLAEYEVLPRMRSFFAAMREALPES